MGGSQAHILDQHPDVLPSPCHLPLPGTFGPYYNPTQTPFPLNQEPVDPPADQTPACADAARASERLDVDHLGTWQAEKLRTFERRRCQSALIELDRGRIKCDGMGEKMRGFVRTRARTTVATRQTDEAGPLRMSTSANGLRKVRKWRIV